MLTFFLTTKMEIYHESTENKNHDEPPSTHHSISKVINVLLIMVPLSSQGTRSEIFQKTPRYHFTSSVTFTASNRFAHRGFTKKILNFLKYKNATSTV